jgi:hypothetical protein
MAELLGAAGDAAAELDDEVGGTAGTPGVGTALEAGGAEVSATDVGPSGASDPTDPAADAVGPVPVALAAAELPAGAPAPTDAGAGALSAAPQSSQYSAPAGFSLWQT